MAIKSTKPVAAKVEKPADKYPISVLAGEYQDKPVVRVTTNEKNYKFDAFSGGATKVRQLFGSDTDGDTIIATLAKWAIENDAISREDLVTWHEKLTAQLEELIKGDELLPY